MRVGFLLRGCEHDKDLDWNIIIDRAVVQLREQGVRVDVVQPERTDPQLQCSLCYRMLQLDYNVIAVRPESLDNLVWSISTAAEPKPVLDLGAVTTQSLVTNAPWYHALPDMPTVQELVQAIISLSMR